MSSRFPRLQRLVLETVLWCYPASFRRRFQSAIRETFEDRTSEARGPADRGVFLIRFLFNGLISGLKERVSPSVVDQHPRQKKKSGFLIQDLRTGVRGLKARPLFAAAAIGTLAVGFGANSAIFSVIYGVLLNPLDYNEPEQLVRIDRAPDSPNGNPAAMSLPDLNDILDQLPSLQTLVGLNAARYTITGSGGPQVLDVNRVTNGLFETFQVTPELGRDIRPDEAGRANSSMIAVLSHGLWQNRFGGDSEIIGKSILLDGVAWEVVGVAPAGFQFPGVDAWVPRFISAEYCGRSCHSMRTIGRLAPGATVASLQSELNDLAVRLESQYPESNTGKRFMARSLHEFVVGDVRQGLTIILGSVVVVLLISCANVANLLLASAARRRNEFALRVALGAPRSRLVSQVLAESFLLAVLGAVSGLVLAFVGVEFFRTLAADTLPRANEISINATVMVATLGISVVSTFLFGAIPALSVSGMAGSGQSGVRATGDRGATRFRSGLLVAEVAMSAALLIAAGLLLRSFTELYRVDLGYQTENVSRFRIGLPVSKYGSLAEVRGFYRELEEEIAAIPGVEAAASVFGPPLGSQSATGTVAIPGRPPSQPGQENEASVHGVSPKYFETLRIPILRGRGLEPSDDRAENGVAVVNEVFVRENFPNEDPIGRTADIHLDLGYGSPTWRIVGVIPDLRSRNLESTAPPMMFVPHGLFGPEDMYLVVRTSGIDIPLYSAVHDALASLDPDVPMYSFETYDDVLRGVLAPATLYAALVATFAVIAGFLSAIGLFGVVSYLVSSRTREIGVRMALGAGGGRVVRHIIARGMQPVAAGLAVGLVIAALGGSLLSSVLYGVQARDPLTFAGAVAMLASVGLAAVVIPAWRASRVDPCTTLRDD